MAARNRRLPLGIRLDAPEAKRFMGPAGTWQQIRKAWYEQVRDLVQRKFPGNEQKRKQYLLLWPGGSAEHWREQLDKLQSDNPGQRKITWFGDDTKRQSNPYWNSDMDAYQQMEENPRISAAFTMGGILRANPYWAPGAMFDQARAEEVINRMQADVPYHIKVLYAIARKDDDNHSTYVSALNPHHSPIKILGGRQVVYSHNYGLEAALVAWHKERFDKAYESQRQMYRIYYIMEAIPEHPRQAPGPFRDGELNCVLQDIRQFLKTGQTRRGKGLTKQKERILDEFEEKFKDTGCRLEDLPELEKELRMKIKLFTVENEVLWDSGKYNTYTRVDLTVHNGHSFAKAPEFPDLKMCEMRTWLAPYQPTKEQQLISLLQEVNQQTACRIWMLGDQVFVTSDGVIYKDQELHKKLSWKVAWDMNVETESKDPTYLAALKETESCVSHLQYHFRVFKKDHHLKPTQKGRREIWKAACVEHIVWGCVDLKKEEIRHIDMVAAFPSFVKHTSEANAYYQEFGLITEELTAKHYSVDAEVKADSPEMQFNGIGEVVGWTFREGLHPYVWSHLSEHFLAKGWTPIPLLAFLLRQNVLNRLKLRSVIIATEPNVSIRFRSFDKTQAREILGYLTRNAQASTMVVKDRGEADFLVKSFANQNRLVGKEEKENAVVITYQDKEARAIYLHARASFLAYSHIALLSQILRLPPQSIHRIATDALFVTNEGLAHAKLTEAKDAEWGEWREKDMPADIETKTNVYDFPRRVMHLEKEYEKPTFPKMTLDPIAQHSISVLGGQGGSGKTHRSVTLFKAHQNIIILTPDNRLMNEHARDYGVPTSTYHKYFALGKGKLSDWTPARLGKRRLHKVVIWDEICKVTKRELETFLPVLKQRGCHVVLCGDPGQLGAFSETYKGGVWKWLQEQKLYTEILMTDYRAKTEKLKAIKLRMWMHSNDVQLQVFREEFPEHEYKAFIDAWHPRDFVMASTHAMGNVLDAELREVHKRKYPKELCPVVYDPVNGKAQNIMVKPPGLKEPMNVCRGTVAWVPLPKGELPRDWKRANWLTVHSAQGSTIKNPRKIWIMDHALASWCDNAVYTAVSRAEYETQIHRVLPPKKEEEKKEQEPDIDAIKKRIDGKIHNYRRRDAAKGFDSDLTVDHVLKLKRVGLNKCAVCKTTLLWGGSYTAQEPRQFSIDRLDNEKGHTKDNVRLTCLGCNRNHRA